ncbi:HNH endonuclease signature motif containing protein [Celeribacter sp.]|uniref:HNH endonuclease signature motif containing protein n=1 Tax=Celeribacter sp. TaxID=1890673 RepID=UPI003A8D81E7
MKGGRIPYSDEELAWIEQHKRMIRRESHALFVEEFGRDDVSLTNYTSLCKRKGWHTGRTGRFEKGTVSWNKGKSMPAHPNSVATRFKKGSTPPNIVPLWTERLGKDGYIEMKVPRPNPWVPGQKTRFMHKHRYLWEEDNGPVPEGYALKCLDGDKTNCDPKNWEAVPRSLLPRLNNQHGRNYDAAPNEVKPTLMAIAKVEQAIQETRRKPET